jgi:hypothetical protein
MILSVISAVRLRPRAAEPQSGRRAGEAGLDLDLVQKLDLVLKLVTVRARALCPTPLDA